MRGFMVVFVLVGFGLLGHGLYGVFGLESANEIGLETMTSVEIGLGAVVVVTALGFIGLFDLLTPVTRDAALTKTTSEPRPAAVVSEVSTSA